MHTARGRDPWVLFGLALVIALASCMHKPPEPAVLARQVAGPMATAVPMDVLTQHGDPQRTGANLHEVALTPARVSSGAFGRLFDWRVDGQIYTQPLYVAQVPTAGKPINIVVVATMNNSVYAFQAPEEGSAQRPSGNPLWVVHEDVLGHHLAYDFLFMPDGIFGFNIKPKVGITATPVIDRARQAVYVTVKSGTGWWFFSRATHQIVALDLLTGAVKARGTIAAQFRNSGHVWTFDAKYQLQRASLLEANDRIYAAFGSHQDTKNYHGWVMGFDAGDLHPVGAYCTTCGRESKNDCDHSCEGGIWQAGGGPAADNAGNLYVITGNGTYGEGNLGTSFLKLDKDLGLVGSWTPITYPCLNRTDSDLGSAGPTYLAAASTLVGGGKEGILYALQPAALQGAQVGGEISASGGAAPCDDGPVPAAAGPGYWSTQASPPWEAKDIMDYLRLLGGVTQGYHHIHGSPVQWTLTTPAGDRTLLYLSAERDYLRAYEFRNGFPEGSPPGKDPVGTFQSPCKNSGNGMPGGFLTLSANGTAADSGIVWALMPRIDKNALVNIVPGVLRAYRAYPRTGRELEELWNSDDGDHIGQCDTESSGGRDQVGLFAKFVPPTVADGKVYVSTFSGRLAVYGLNAPPGPAPAAASEPHAAVPVGAARHASEFDADLKFVGPPAATVDAGTRVPVRITATNQGTRTWHAADAIRLSSQTILPGEYGAPDASTLKIVRDVGPGDSIQFDFSIVAPPNEAVHYLTWRLVRDDAPADPWIGSPTPQWKFVTLLKTCSDSHQRAQELVRRIKFDGLHSSGIEDDIARLRVTAKSLHCALDADVVNADGADSMTP